MVRRPLAFFEDLQRLSGGFDGLLWFVGLDQLRVDDLDQLPVPADGLIPLTTLRAGVARLATRRQLCRSHCSADLIPMALAEALAVVGCIAVFYDAGGKHPCPELVASPGQPGVVLAAKTLTHRRADAPLVIDLPAAYLATLMLVVGPHRNVSH